MSIINDALKKAEKNKQPSQDNPSQILSKINKMKAGAERFGFKRWLIWAGTGVVCLLGVFLAINSFKSPTDSVPIQETVSQTGLAQNVFHLRKMDVEAPLRTSGFRLSGILYDTQRPLAIINQRVVEKGAFIKGAQLLEINPNYVRLSLHGEEFTLKIK